MCEEGKSALEKLLKFMVHPAISSINLTTALGSLATIARQRPMFMSEVVQAYETLHGECFLVKKIYIYYPLNIIIKVQSLIFIFFSS